MQQKQSFEQWALSYCYDPIFGYLVQPQYQPKSFNKQPLVTCLQNLDVKIQAQTIQHQIQKIGELNINFEERQQMNFSLHKDYSVLHALLSKILYALLNEKRKQGLSDEKIVVPKNIAIPLRKVSSILGLKVGMTTDYNINWFISNFSTQKGFPEDIKLLDVKLINYFTQPKTDQCLFFGASIVGSFYLYKNIKTLYQINQNIMHQPLQKVNQNIKLMNTVQQNLNKINLSLQQLLDLMNGDIFYNQVRRFVGGYTNVKFQGVEQLQSSSGAAGGDDPSFQIFQNMIGLKFEGKHKEMSQKFQQNFTFPIKRFIKQIPETFFISQYFRRDQQLSSAYKKVVKKYADFWLIHREIIKRFILNINPNAEKGTAGQTIADTMVKNQAISKQIQP